MSLPDAVSAPALEHAPGLRRTVGFWGLSFVSLGSIIGSGWLLGALTAAGIAGGGGSLVSWVLAGVMLMVLALIHADLGAAYPVAGGTSRYPHYAFGGFAGFTAGWATYLQAVAIAPLEVEASLSYVNSIGDVGSSFPLVNSDGTLTPGGMGVGVVAMLLFAAINLGGAKWLSDSNTWIVLWKIFVPVLTIVTLLAIDFHPGNFTVGGFAPNGLHGIFAALPAGVVFALQGFEQATQMAGESVDPRRHVAKAIILAMAVGAVVYVGLEIAFVGALDPDALGSGGWAHPIGAGDYGPYYTLAEHLGVIWLAVILIVDAVVSPGGTGLIYVGTTARISYALGLPKAMTNVDRRGVPVWAVVVATVFGVLFLLPAPSWQQLVGVITGATAIMYGFAPISLGALLKNDTDRDRPYRLPWPRVLLPLGFVFANLIVYWGGFAVTWKLIIGLAVGQLVFIAASAARGKTAGARWGSAGWIWVWFAAMFATGILGNYGEGALKVLPEDWDALIISAVSLLVYYMAVSAGQPQADVKIAVCEDLEQSAGYPAENP